MLVKFKNLFYKLTMFNFIIISTISFTSCNTNRTREDYYNYSNSKNYQKIAAKNVICKNSICEAYIISVTPRETALPSFGIRAGDPTERTHKIKFFCKEHKMASMMFVERSLDKLKVLDSFDYKDNEDKSNVMPNSYISEWESYACHGQKGFVSLN